MHVTLVVLEGHSTAFPTRRPRGAPNPRAMRGFESRCTTRRPRGAPNPRAMRGCPRNMPTRNPRSTRVLSPMTCSPPPGMRVVHATYPRVTLGPRVYCPP